MKVRVKREHGNAYGARWDKKRGDTYGVPEDQAAALIAAGLVEEDGRPAPKRKPKRSAAKPLAAEVEAAGGADHGPA